MKKKDKRYVSYEEFLIKSLKDKKEAAGYLNAVLEECRDGSKESQELLLMALRDIAKAQGGISQLSSTTGLGRESLYKALSKNGNPKLSTLTTLISAMGFELKVELPSKR